MYDSLIQDPPKYISTISDCLYGANVEYIANLICNNHARLMPVVEALAISAQTSTESINYAYLILMDISYIFCNDVANNLPSDVNNIIADIKNKRTANDLIEFLREIISALPKIQLYYFDYNSIFKSIHAKYHPSPNQKEASIEIENVAAINKVIVNRTPVTSLMLNKNELAELLTYTGVGTTGTHIIPCYYGGDPKGIIILEIEGNQLIDLPHLLGTIVIGKYIAKIVFESAEELTAMRYYYDFVQQHGFAVKSLVHEVNFALGRMIDSTNFLRKSQNSTRDELDVISDLEEARDIVDNAVQSMKAYSDPKVVEKHINEVIENVIKVLKTYLKKEKIIVQFNKDISCSVIVSGTNINTILTNLITNSVNATRACVTDREISITAKSTRDNILVTISDNGCGIPAAIRDEIFRDGFTTGGSGVGLSIVKLLVKEMGGEINIGHPVVGAEITVSFLKGGRYV